MAGIQERGESERERMVARSVTRLVVRPVVVARSARERGDNLPCVRREKEETVCLMARSSVV